MTDETESSVGLGQIIEAYEYREWESDPNGTLRVALIGIGWWTAEMVIPAISDLDHCEATVAVSSSTEKARSIVDEVKSVERGITYDEFHEGEAADAYDAVYICTPNAYHLEYAETAATLGKAVLCEKPMEATAERAAAMVDACEEADVPLLVGYRMQTEPLVRHARELIRAGKIGEPVAAIGNNSQTLLDIFDDPDQWRLDPDATGYGTSVMDLGIYPLNTTRFLLEADPVSVQSAMASSHDAFHEVPDERAAFTVTLDDGTILTATSSQNAHATTSLRIIGTEGELIFEPAFHMETDLRIERGEHTVTFESDQVDQMTELFAYFADRVLSEGEIEPDGVHGLVDMEALRAIYEAGETGKTVGIDVEQYL
ncbi:D-xylose 1-dehydrogenase Gfo6 [Natrialbaceae archaeon A-chndr2]